MQRWPAFGLPELTHTQCCCLSHCSPFQLFLPAGNRIPQRTFTALADVCYVCVHMFAPREGKGRGGEGRGLISHGLYIID